VSTVVSDARAFFDRSRETYDVVYSMLGGLRSTALLARVLYLLAFLLLRRQKAPAATV
jgi:hypothetical protein